jgi:hypothetical protein
VGMQQAAVGFFTVAEAQAARRSVHGFILPEGRHQLMTEDYSWELPKGMGTDTYALPLSEEVPTLPSGTPSAHLALTTADLSSSLGTLPSAVSSSSSTLLPETLTPLYSFPCPTQASTVQSEQPLPLFDTIPCNVILVCPQPKRAWKPDVLTDNKFATLKDTLVRERDRARAESQDSSASSLNLLLMTPPDGPSWHIPSVEVPNGVVDGVACEMAWKNLFDLGLNGVPPCLGDHPFPTLAIPSPWPAPGPAVSFASDNIAVVPWEALSLMMAGNTELFHSHGDPHEN